MQRKHHLIRTPLVAALTVVSCAWGLSASAMDFHQAYEAALRNDAQIRAARAAAKAARERLPQAVSQLRPNVSATIGRNYNDLISEGRSLLGQRTETQSNYFSGNKTLSVRQPLYRPYQMAAVEQAKAQVQEADATLERDEQSLVVRLGEAYFEALLADDQLTLVLSQRATYARQLDAAQKGLAAGTGTRTDIDEAQARLDMTIAQELEARQNREFTRHRLEAMTGEPSTDLVGLPMGPFQAEAPMPATVDAWIERAEAASPELQQLRAQQTAARMEIEKAEAGHRPTLDAVAQWARTSSDSIYAVNSRYDNKVLGLQLSVPLYSGGYVNSTVRQALASHQRAEEALEAARRDLAVRVRKEFRGMTEGAARIQALEQSVRSAEQAVLSNRRSFEAGYRTTIDVLNAEHQKTTAQRDLAQARYLYLVSRLRLQSLAGEERAANARDVNRWLLATAKP